VEAPPPLVPEPPPEPPPPPPPAPCAIAGRAKPTARAKAVAVSSRFMSSISISILICASGNGVNPLSFNPQRVASKKGSHPRNAVRASARASPGVPSRHRVHAPLPPRCPRAAIPRQLARLLSTRDGSVAPRAACSRRRYLRRPGIVVRTTSKITAVDHPNRRRPLVPVIGPISAHSSGAAMSPWPIVV
jgi:hypothetical protein